MTLRSSSSTYGRVAVILHWAVVLLIMPMVSLGLTMVGMEPGPDKDSFYRTHAILGLVVGALTLVRAIWRFTEPTPALPAGISGNHAWLYKGVHIGFYVVIISLALSGMGTLALSGLNAFTVTAQAINRDAPSITGHFILSRIYMALFALHLLGVLRYQFGEGNVFARMGLGWLKLGKQNQP